MQQSASDPLKKETPPERPDLHAEEDGRNREWEDRARVNLETTPAGIHTNLERDFEPEQEEKEKEEPPAY